MKTWPTCFALIPASEYGNVNFGDEWSPAVLKGRWQRGVTVRRSKFPSGSRECWFGKIFDLQGRNHQFDYCPGLKEKAIFIIIRLSHISFCCYCYCCCYCCFVVGKADSLSQLSATMARFSPRRLLPEPLVNVLNHPASILPFPSRFFGSHMNQHITILTDPASVTPHHAWR